jgi:hypothetical protein
MKSKYYFDLHFFYNQGDWILLYIFIDHLYLFLWEFPILFMCPFLHWNIDSLGAEFFEFPSTGVSLSHRQRRGTPFSSIVPIPSLLRLLSFHFLFEIPVSWHSSSNGNLETLSHIHLKVNLCGHFFYWVLEQLVFEMWNEEIVFHLVTYWSVKVWGIDIREHINMVFICSFTYHSFK